MKIKVEKKMTHGEFAKCIVDKIGIASFNRNLADGEWCGSPSDIYIASINLNPAKFDDFAHIIRIDEDTVTFKTFEEITEDTVIPELVELYEDFLESNEILKHENRSINEAKDEDECASQAFYIINDDLTMTLIWRDGKLVE